MNLLGVLPYWQFGPWPKEAFELGPVPLQIHSFGLMVAIGLLIGFSYLSWRSERKMGISGEEAQNYGLFLVIIGWPLSHVFNVIFYEPQKLAEDPLVLFEIWGSISSYGGFFGGVIAFLIWSARHPKLSRLDWAEIGAMGIVIPWFFGRIGCATVHDHPGAIASESWPLAIDFPARINLPAGPRHDLGLYEAIWWGVILAVMLILDRKPRKAGFFIPFLAIMYAPARFLFDFFRVPQDMGGDIRYFGLTPAQYFSVGIFIAGLAVAWRIRNNKVREWETYEPEPPTLDEDAEEELGDDDEPPKKKK